MVAKAKVSKVECPCCLEPAKALRNNRWTHKGKYCDKCHSEWIAGNASYFEEMRLRRLQSRRAKRLEADSFKCRMCGCLKSRSDFIKNKSTTFGIADRCKDCDKVRHQEEFERRPELRDYHRAYVIERSKVGLTQRATTKWYNKQKELMSDKYILIQLKSKDVYKLLGRENIPQYLIEAKRIKMKLNKELAK